MFRFLKTSGLAIALCLLTGCAHVSPAERGKLAHFSMSTGRLSNPSEEHLFAIQEGATGGSGAAESGCGCN